MRCSATLRKSIQDECSEPAAKVAMTELLKHQGVPDGFETPTALPKNSTEQESWQEANRSWWENNPMRYDWKDKVSYEEFSPEFYAEIDRRFFAAAQSFARWKKSPFDSMIDLENLAAKDVLEIGVGNGSHAQLLATHAKSFAGIDLTNYAVKSTSERLRLKGLKGTIRQMDAERMDFADNSFDFIWSWGVIHHSANTRAVVEQMHRVLRPGGLAVVMVYHRTLWNYYVHGTLLAILSGQALRRGALHMSTQLNTDGALARYYTGNEWKELVSDLFTVNAIRCYGNKAELFPLPQGRLKGFLLRRTPDSVSRFFLNKCSLGTFLVATMSKRP
jgi:2-polyprenyl-3-methyl-5-hydroxy-6-metoxy-1,4-benzoquinol methylase